MAVQRSGKFQCEDQAGRYTNRSAAGVSTKQCFGNWHSDSNLSRHQQRRRRRLYQKRAWTFVFYHVGSVRRDPLRHRTTASERSIRSGPRRPGERLSDCDIRSDADEPPLPGDRVRGASFSCRHAAPLPARRQLVMKRESAAPVPKLPDVGPSVPSSGGVHPQVFRKRWLVLAIFVLLSASNAFQWIEYAIISNIISEFYDVPYIAVDWTSMIYMCVTVSLRSITLKEISGASPSAPAATAVYG